MSQALQQTQNWEALLKLEMRLGEDKTHLVPIKRSGPLTVQRPFYPEQGCCHVYLLHPPGGIVGGDSLDFQVNCKSGSQSLFTAPGATKFYLSASDTAIVKQNFVVERDSHIEFLPQENIYFPGAQVKSKSSIDIESGGCLMLWEKHCFGRPANNEFFSTGKLTSNIELHSEGNLIYTETQRIDAAEIQRSSGLRNFPVVGSFLIYGLDLQKKPVTRSAAYQAS